MKISVVVPFHNEQEFIDRCARSLLDQDFDPCLYEIIFIDNASTDHSCEIVERYPRITLLHESRPGSYAARNTGIRAARGEIIAFTDADCMVSKNWLSCIHESLAAKNAVMAVGKRHYAPGCSRILRLLEAYENTKIERILGTPLDGKYVFGYTNNMAIRANVFEREGLFAEIARGGDTAYVQRCLCSEGVPRPVFLEDMTVFHLEITRLRHWLSKKRIRGKSNREIARSSTYRELPLPARLGLFAAAVKHEGYGIAEAFVLFGLLVLGNLAYEIGASGAHPFAEE